MPDRFASHASSLEAPAEELYEITPDDGADLSQPTRAINVAGAGAVRLTTIHGTTATVYVAAGGAFPVRARRILATGTTATGIVGLA